MMRSKKRGVVSSTTRNNLILDSMLLTGGVISALSGIYFLFFPVGGFQGGRNPWYGLTVLFERHTWDDLHTWSSVALIAAAALHIPLHWRWIVSMTRRGLRSLSGQCSLNRHSQFNLAVNILVGLIGVVTAVSGLYFLLVPGAAHHSSLPDPGLLFSRLTWDLIHTWSGVVLIAAAVLHFWIHWKWFYKVIGKYWRAAAGQIQKHRFRRETGNSAAGK